MAAFHLYNSNLRNEPLVTDALLWMTVAWVQLHNTGFGLGAPSPIFFHGQKKKNCAYHPPYGSSHRVSESRADVPKTEVHRCENVCCCRLSAHADLALD